MYPKPLGYNTLAFVNGLHGRSYVPNNGFVSGSMAYAAGAPGSQVITITFLAVPDDTTQWEVPDGPGNNPGNFIAPFQYDYAGAPGTGIIPLLAGGGTITACTAATAAVLNAQLNNWTVTNPTNDTVVMTYTPKGFNVSSALLAAMVADLINTGLEGPATALSALLAGPSGVLPGRFGKNYCILPA